MIVKLAWDFAKKYNRPTLYDSFYLAAAKEIESELCTADRKLILYCISRVLYIFGDNDEKYIVD